LQEAYPFEDTNCAICGTSIGGHLRTNDETGHDYPIFDSIFELPDDRAVCEDCAMGEAE
jgi:hypothetical protein